MDTALVLPLLDTITAGLERARPVTLQVARHIQEAHDVAREKVGAFLTETLPHLEEHEVDLVLAPLFTPTLADQAESAELLGTTSVVAAQWPEIVQRLAARPTVAQLWTEDDMLHAVPLRVVTVERFVHRLRLDGTIADEIFSLIGSLPAPGDRAWLKAIARRAIWERPGRREILSRYLKVVGDACRVPETAALLRLVETYEPADVAELLARIPQWQQVLRQEINNAGARPFFNERVEELHGGGRDQRRQADGRLAAKISEQAFLERLHRTLQGG